MNFYTHIEKQGFILSTADFEKLLFLYKMEGKNMSIQIFYVNNGVNSKMTLGQLILD